MAALTGDPSASGENSPQEGDKQDSDKLNETETKRRRTERVRREKPDYYDPLQYEKQKLIMRGKKGMRSGNSPRKGTDDGGEGQKKKRKRRIKPGSIMDGKQGLDGRNETMQPDEEEDIMENVSAEKLAMYNLVLAEINKKIILAGWKQH